MKTAAELLSGFAAADIRLSVSEGKLLVDAPAGCLTDELRATLSNRKADLIAAISEIAAKRNGGQAIHPWQASAPLPAPPKPPPTAWPDADTAAAADLCLLLTPDDLPPAPFQFGGRWCVVVSRERFLAALQSDVKAGPRGPRAKTGALYADLRRLRTMLLDTPRPAGQP